MAAMADSQSNVPSASTESQGKKRGAWNDNNEYWQKIENKGKTNVTVQKQCLQMRADTLYKKHYYDVVVLFHSCKPGGKTERHIFDFYATPGKARQFMGGKSLGGIVFRAFKSFFLEQQPSTRGASVDLPESDEAEITSSATSPAFIDTSSSGEPRAKRKRNLKSPKHPAVSSNVSAIPHAQPSTVSVIPPAQPSTVSSIPHAQPSTVSALPLAQPSTVIPPAQPSTAIPPAQPSTAIPPAQPSTVSAIPPAQPSTGDVGDIVAYHVGGRVLACGQVQRGRNKMHGCSIPTSHVCVLITKTLPNIAAPLVLGDVSENSYLNNGQFFALPLAHLKAAKLKSNNSLELRPFV